MRAPFQILAIPYRIVDGTPIYCVFHRADHDQWQFIAGGGEDRETPAEAAVREIFEEGGVFGAKVIPLTSMCYIRADIFPKRHLYGWPEDMYVLPEYAFGFECAEEIRLSHEHTECVWLSFDKAYAKLQWDSNRTALYELHCRLTKQ
jgi:dATP pyrophosphohydrolase